MRIAVVADTYPGVSETFVSDQVRRFVAAGHEVVVVADRPAQPDPAVRYRREPPGSTLGRAVAALGAVLRARSFGFVRALVGADAPLGLALWAEPLVAAGRFDVVISHFGWNARKVAQLRPALRGAKLVAVLHGADLTSWAGDDGPGVYRPVFEQSDLLLPVSDRWRDLLVGWGAPPERTIVHRVGVDLQRFTPVDPSPGEEVRLLSIARLTEKKGIEHAIRAVAGLPVRYDVVGDGPLRAQHEALAGPNVHFHGALGPAEVAGRLHDADILLAPSVTAADGDQEGIPVAIMEAMAMGLPVISTFHSGIPELIEDGVSGLLVPERDDEALAAAIRRLVDDADLRRRLGTAGRDVVAERHDAARLHQELEALLTSGRGR